MRVTIASEQKTESGTSKNGKAYTARSQDAYLHEPGKPFPTSCTLPLYDNARPYPLGDYECKQDLEISEFGKLRVKSEITLVAAPAK